MKKKITILLHKNHQPKFTRSYVIYYLAKHWSEDGHEVTFLRGVHRFVPADICIVHVDLSVVPTEYIEFAHRYPIVVNGKVTDIRKRHFSRNLVQKDSPYQGQVIVKSNENHAGLPERRLADRKITSLFLPRPFKSPRDYKLYQDLNSVPDRYFEDHHFVVEKFLPEFKNGLYHVNLYLFFGDRHNCVRLASKKPIVNGRTSVSSESVAPHPKIIEYRKFLGFDYGKFDYCLNHDEPVLIDTNKTVSFGGFEYNDELAQQHRHRAQGLYQFF